MKISFTQLQDLTLNDCIDFPDGLEIPNHIFEQDKLAQELVAKEIYLFEEGIKSFFTEEEAELFVKEYEAILIELKELGRERLSEFFNKQYLSDVPEMMWILFMTLCNKRNK